MTWGSLSIGGDDGDGSPDYVSRQYGGLLRCRYTLTHTLLPNVRHRKMMDSTARGNKPGRGERLWEGIWNEAEHYTIGKAPGVSFKSAFLGMGRILDLSVTGRRRFWGHLSSFLDTHLAQRAEMQFLLASIFRGDVPLLGRFADKKGRAKL